MTRLRVAGHPPYRQLSCSAMTTFDIHWCDDPLYRRARVSSHHIVQLPPQPCSDYTARAGRGVAPLADMMMQNPGESIRDLK
eukprot:876880-Amphidinium_carterae.1